MQTAFPRKIHDFCNAVLELDIDEIKDSAVDIYSHAIYTM